MASAWLIRKFIDPKAHFIFSSTIDTTQNDVITYDMNDATFTHLGDLCTFEVLVLAFCINDKKVKEIAKIIHNLDIKDDKYSTPQAEGISTILASIRQQTLNDSEILVQSNLIFDYLYASSE
jgi:hypothetical protein